LDRAQQEIALSREELHIHKLRMAQLSPHRRPHYRPTERMAILQFKAVCGWSLEQTSQEFLVTTDAIRSWLRRVDEEGPNALVQLREPVNKFPQFVRYIVQQLKALCPMLGKVKIAQILARAGLHLGATTVGRMLKENRAPQRTENRQKEGKKRVATSKYRNHLWEMDLTTIPIGRGFWTTWQPFSLPQCWPFGWWVGVIMDHYSRRIMGITRFEREPTSEAMRAFLGRVIYAAGAKPRPGRGDTRNPKDAPSFISAATSAKISEARSASEHLSPELPRPVRRGLDRLRRPGWTGRSWSRAPERSI
jgi:hypothetical protein